MMEKESYRRKGNLPGNRISLFYFRRVTDTEGEEVQQAQIKTRADVPKHFFSCNFWKRNFAHCLQDRNTYEYEKQSDSTCNQKPYLLISSCAS